MNDNFKKRDTILKNKEYIIKAYCNNVSISNIAKIYGVTDGCISNKLELWGVRRKHGIKYILRKMIS